MSKTLEMIADICEHDFQYLETLYTSIPDSCYQSKYIGVDRFYCRKCLQEKGNRREEWSREAPWWWRGKK